MRQKSRGEAEDWVGVKKNPGRWKMSLSCTSQCARPAEEGSMQRAGEDSFENGEVVMTMQMRRSSACTLRASGIPMRWRNICAQEYTTNVASSPGW
jgi:hypothetical protein